MDMSSRSEVSPKPRGHNRRGFLQNSGGVVGALTVGAMAPAAALALEGTAAAAPAPAVSVPARSEALPDEPVMAYVSNSERSEVTVLSGTQETTFYDPVLTRRLLQASRSHTS